MPFPICTVAVSFNAELRSQKNFFMGDPMSYMLSDITKLTLEQNGIYYPAMRTFNFSLDETDGTGETFMITVIVA